MILSLIFLSILQCLFGFFSASESSFNLIEEYELAQIKSKASGRLDKKLQLWISNPEVFRYSLSVSIILTVSSAIAMIVSMGQSFSSPENLPNWVAVAASLFFILGHVIPKTYARRNPSKIFVPAIRIAGMLLFLGRPIALLFPKLTATKKDLETAKDLSEEKLEFIVTEGQMSGVIGDIKKDIIEGAFEIDDTKVREVMTPRMDMIAAPGTASMDELRKIFIDSGHSRIPVFKNDLDEVTGIVLVKDFMRVETDQAQKITAADLQREVTFAPESKSLAEVFKELKKAKSHLAIIIDEYGGTSGIVTMEDILEEIVGEIQDEFDMEEAGIIEGEAGKYQVLGWVNVEEFFDFFDIPEEDIALDKRPKNVDTLAGWVTQLTQEIPKIGQTVEIGPVKMEIIETERRRIKKINIERLQHEVGTQPEAELITK